MTNKPNNDFIMDYQVGDKTYRLDALLVLAELALTGSQENPSQEQLIAAIKSAIRPVEQAGTLTDAEAFALSLRVTMSLKSLGNVGAP